MDRTKEEIFYLKYIYFLVLIIISVICYTYYININNYKIMTDDTLFEAAKIGSSGFMSEGLQSDRNILDTIYVKMLSVFCIFLGNSIKTALYLNVVIELCSVIMVYALLLKIVNIKYSFICSMIYACILLSLKMWSKVDKSSLFLFMLPLGLYVFICVCKLFCNTIQQKFKSKVQISANTNDENDIPVTDGGVKEKIGMREIFPEDIGVKKTEFIENPLPLPKKKEHKKMDYAIELSQDNDDYDILDMTGMDFFDIE